MRIAPRETVRSAIEYFRDSEVSPHDSQQTSELYEKVSKRQAINGRHRELTEQREIIGSPLGGNQKMDAIKEYRQKSSELLRLEKDSRVKPHKKLLCLSGERLLF